MRFTIHDPKEFLKLANPPYQQVVEAIIDNPAVLKATKYMSPTLIVRAVRKSYKFNNRKTGKIKNIEITLTLGKPNFLEREFIKACQKAKEPFPIKRVQLKLWNAPKKKLEKKLKK